MCEFKISSPAGVLEVKIREFDYPHLNTIAELIFNMGEFKLQAMKEALFIYLEDILSKA